MRLVYLALGWAAGILLAANAAANAPLRLPIWSLLVLLALVVGWLGWRYSSRRWLALALLAFTLGGLRFTFVPQDSGVTQYNNAGGLTIEGVVSVEPDRRDDRVLLRVEAETVTHIGQTAATSGTVLVDAPPTTNIRYGDRVRATGILITPAESDTFSYADYLARSGVFSIMRDTSIEVLSQGNGSPINSELLEFKRSAPCH
jgi:competence protein ComEC